MSNKTTLEPKTDAYTLKKICVDTKSNGIGGEGEYFAKGSIVKLSPMQLIHFQRSKAVTLDIPQELLNG